MAREYNDEYWSKEADSFNLTMFLIRRLRPVFARSYARIMAPLIPASVRPRVLEAGCGTAATLHYLKALRPGISGFGIDSSRVAIEIARETERGSSFFMGDALNLSFRGGFDLVYSIGLIEHYSRERAVELLREKRRVTKEGGWVGAVVPARVGLLNLYEKCLGSQWLFAEEFPFSPSELQDLMERASLRDVRVHYVYAMTLLGVGRVSRGSSPSL